MDFQETVSIKQFICQLGINSPRLFDPEIDPNFKILHNGIELYFKISQITKLLTEYITGLLHL